MPLNSLRISLADYVQLSLQAGFIQRPAIRHPYHHVKGQRWLFYAYDSLRKTVVAHVFGERTMATLGRLMSLLSPFDVVIWMTDGWPLYESRLKGKLHVISKRYTQRIERHNLNLRQHL
uniref:IS1 transposase n=1 Tax=Brassica oleracea var. oleracea TaxID=109376 RepID=A0A0D2ZZH2_BRAOL